MAILDFEELKKSICVCSFRKEISGSQLLFFWGFLSDFFKIIYNWKFYLPTTSLSHSKVELGKVPNGFGIQNIFNLLLFFLVQMFFISY